MESPFPGMDLYLEQPAFWSSFHSRFIVATADVIEPQLSPNYYVEVETRVYQAYGENDAVLVGIPDAMVIADDQHKSTPQAEASVVTQIRPQRVTVPLPLEVKERYLEVRESQTNEVITVIELLSPKNKRTGEGRIAYERKRQAILGSATHLVELDLLRAGKPMPILGRPIATTYRILISRSHQRPAADLYTVSLQQPLPTIPIPLKVGGPEPQIALQQIFDGVYQRARYSARLDYRQSPPPPRLSEADQQWLEAQLAAVRAN